jgi:hypothetical protein
MSKLQSLMPKPAQTAVDNSQIDLNNAQTAVTNAQQPWQPLKRHSRPLKLLWPIPSPQLFLEKCDV